VHYKLDRGVESRADRRGAGHQPPAVGHHRLHHLGIHHGGAGARDGVVRTVFAVGDEKQSIFSFQGAAPREFDARRWELKKKFEDAELKFESIPFTYSFRSGQAT
jgi:ATP-dependent helicase/nuclease subunit A